MGLPLETQSYYNNGGGLNLKYSATKVPENESSLCLNIDYTVDGAFATRYGSTIMNVAGTPPIPVQMAGAPKTLLIEQYKSSTGTEVNIVAAGTTLKTGLVTPTNAVTGISGLLPYPDMQFFVTNDGEYMIWGNGVDTNLKFNVTTWTNLSLPRPTAPTFAADGVGVLPAGTYDYYVSFVRTVAGVIVQESELSPIAQHTIAGPFSINLVVPVCTETLLPGVTAQCNGRVVYRKNNTTGVVYRITPGVTIADNVTTAYNDNTTDANLSTVEADFDIEAAPKSKVFEENFQQMVYVDSASSTDYLVSVPNLPWNVRPSSRTILDGPIQCMKRVFSTLILGTDRSIWVINGDPLTADPRRVSSAVGILNNRCAVSQDTGILYILTTNRKIYSLTATDFSQNEIRFTDPLSLKIDPLMVQIYPTDPEIPCMESYTTPNVNKVVLSCPIGQSTNNRLIIYNESQAIINGSPCWQVYDNTFASALSQLTIGGIQNLYSGDYNGFLWKLDDSSTYGDGSEENGTVTAATTTTITDSSQTWVVNEHVGKVVRVISGPGVDQAGTITSNTATQVTFTPAFSVTPTTASTFTVGGYDVYHYSNWKYVLSSYDFLKQLWFLWINANASGDYTITMITQFDFDQTTTGQNETNVNLRAGNAIWGAFIWGAAIWGSQEVFEDRFRQFARFRAMRVAFQNRKAGQPFQINGFAISSQDKKLFFRSES